MSSQRRSKEVFLRAVGKPYGLFLILACFLLMTSCGDGSGGDWAPTSFQGTIVDTSGAPVSDATVFIFDTNEAAILDESGAFFIESFRHLTSARFYLFTSNYTNTVEIDGIPDDAALVTLAFRLDRTGNAIELTAVSFDSSGPIQSSSSSSSEADGGTSSSGISASSSSAGASTGSSAATPTPTPKPGNFDENGNTTAFGIPAGITGNINAGRSIWNSMCQACHASEKTARSYNQIKSSFRSIPQMQSLSISNQQIAHVTAYLNRAKR